MDEGTAFCKQAVTKFSWILCVFSAKLHHWNSNTQEALSRKADKAYTKRQMAVLVSRVSALLKEESDEPSMAKKCLSCDRAFNKLSFKDLELAQQVSIV